jgi:hypothetical protein
VLDLHKPDEMQSHVLVSEGDEPGTFLIQDVDVHAMNPYTAVLEDPDIPTKGEGRIFTGTPEELYEELKTADRENKVIASRGIRKLLRNVHQVPMVFGHVSDFTGPALVFAEYRAFRQIEKQYKANPKQVGLAYHFINSHPMFWHVRQHRKDEEKFDVVTGRGWDRLDFMVSNKIDQSGAMKTTVMIECGPGNYHDYNLDVYAKSFDKAVLKLAKLISKHYDSHGGFTDTSKKEPNDNFFRESDEEQS